MNAIEELSEAIENAVGEDAAGTLSILTGAFVGLTLGMLKQAGHKPDGDIKIDSNGGRDITIHAQEVE